MTLIGWPRCCQQAYEAEFYGWMALNYATMNATMSGALSGEIKRLLPYVADMLDEFRIVARVVDAPASFDAHVASRTCKDGHAVRIAFVSSRLLFLVWRLLIMVGAACIAADPVPTGVRFRVRPPNSADVAQLRQAIETYVRAGPHNPAALDELVAALEAAPADARSLFTTLATVAEAYVILHEVGHVLSAPSVREATLGDVPMNPARRAAWEDELRADLSAWELLLLGLMSAMIKPPQDGDADVEAEVQAGRAARAHAFDLISSAVTGVYVATWFASRAVAPGGGAPRMPARSDPQYRTHPPVQVRQLALENWVAARTAQTDTPNHRTLSQLVGAWMWALAELTFGEAPADDRAPD